MASSKTETEETENVATITVPTGQLPARQLPTLKLRLQRPQSDRRVSWSTETIDNEHMNKRKSKCCCIYRKPYAFGESSSSDDEECEHCFGHPEKRRRNRKTLAEPENPDDTAMPGTSQEQKSETREGKEPEPDLAGPGVFTELPVKKA